MNTRRLFILLGPVLAVIAILSIITAVNRTSEQAQAANCAKSMTSIGLGARLWAEAHGGLMPANFLCLSNELNNPKILSCVPSRRARSSDWSALAPTNCTYQITAPGLAMQDTNTVYLRCTVHGHLGFSDGTSFDGKRRRGKTE